MYKRKNELRDIYQASEQDFEKDFTPQIAQEVFEARQRDLRRSRIFSIFFGVLAAALFIALIALLFRTRLLDPARARQARSTDSTAAQDAALANALWVMEYQPDPEKNNFDAPSGPAPVSVAGIKTAASYTVQGQQALALNHPEQALDWFQKVVGLYPDIQGLHRAMGVLYLQREAYADAAAHLEKALAEEELFDVVVNLGVAYSGLKDYARAEPYFKQALEMQPNNSGCHKNLADLYDKMDRMNDAVFHFEKYIDLRPDDLDTRQSYALFLTKIGRWKEAAPVLTELVQELPDVAPLYFLLAQAQLQNGQPEKAVDALKNGVQLIDPDLARTWLAREDFNVLRNQTGFKQLLAPLK
jgi:tetratricopeptide (TPR) repeat protein